jgi:hypothetical protein
VVLDWGERMGNQDKVPSVISYSRSSHNGEQQWGSDLSKDAIAMVHTKLRLDIDDTSAELDQILETLEGIDNLNFQYVRNLEGLPKFTRKGPEEIVADYLEKVFGRFIEAISSFTPEWRARTPVDIVATIPAVRSHTKRRTVIYAG